MTGVAAGALVAALYLVANFVRFGSPFEAGYANIVSEPFVNRLTRWGVEFQTTPFVIAAKELFATLFLLEPVARPILSVSPATVPASVAPYAVGERWREYYSQTYDLWVFAAWVATFAIVTGRIVRQRLWRRDRDLDDQVTTIVGLWALPPSLVLFVFYAKVHLVTRYLVDLCPAYAAALVCVGMAVVDIVRKRAPRRVAAAQAAIAAIAGALLRPLHGERVAAPAVASGGPQYGGRATRGDRQALEPAADPARPHPEHRHPRARADLRPSRGWKRDGSFVSGMIFAFPRSPCITFTLRPAGNAGWGPAEDESLAGFRARGDFDTLVSCDAAGAPEGDARRVTMCEPHPPHFLVDGMRLYAIATLDANLRAIDRLQLTRIDAADACPSAPP